MVHPSCYGIIGTVDSYWRCVECLARLKKPDISCLACPSKAKGLKPTTDNRWMHISCALWLPKVVFQNVDALQPIDLSGIDAERFKLVFD